MEIGAEGKETVRRACGLWRGFLMTQASNPEMALIFCKGALLSLNKEKGTA
jgi:hypothetical protein